MSPTVPLIPSPSLRDHLLSGLSSLPNPKTLSLTVLTSSPKRTAAVFPYAYPPPKCLEREYLITVGTTIPPTVPGRPVKTGSASNSGAGPSSSVPLQPLTSSTPLPPLPTEPSAPDHSPSLEQTVLVSALHAYLYTVPQTATSILYISKTDSSGYSPSRVQATRRLLTSFLQYHLLPILRPARRVYVQLFARSQGQYLFSNSSQAEGKKVLGGLGLCQWWKGVYEEVASAVMGRIGKEEELGLGYLLPSYSEDEAKGMLRASRITFTPSLTWRYQRPFGDPVLGTDSSLACLIPALPDDPKTRFIDELVAESEGRGSLVNLDGNDHDETINPLKRKKPDLKSKQSRKEKVSEDDEQQRKRATQILVSVSTEEFWERMGFRQECISGDVTGFFTLSLKPRSGVGDEGTNGEMEPAPDGGAKEEPTSDLASTVDGQEATTSTAGSMRKEKSPLGQAQQEAEVEKTPPSCSAELSHTIVDRLHIALLNVDFGTRELAIEGSAIWLKSARAIIVDEIGENGYRACVGEVPAKCGLEETAKVSGVGEERKEEVVTVLQVRKKRKI